MKISKTLFVILAIIGLVIFSFLIGEFLVYIGFYSENFDVKRFMRGSMFIWLAFILFLYDYFKKHNKFKKTKKDNIEYTYHKI